MGSNRGETPRCELFEKPGTVVLFGLDHGLANWVAYALASPDPASYHWCDVHAADQPFHPEGPLALGRVPDDHLSLLSMEQLRGGEPPTEQAVDTVIQPGEPPSLLQSLMDYLRLPAHTQRLLASQKAGDLPIVFVLSNAQRVHAYYSPEALAAVLRIFVECATCLFLVYVDVPPVSRFEFDHVLHLRGGSVEHWGDAQLWVEKGVSAGRFARGTKVRLKDLPPVASVLSRELGTPGA